MIDLQYLHAGQFKDATPAQREAQGKFLPHPFPPARRPQRSDVAAGVAERHQAVLQEAALWARIHARHRQGGSALSA